MEFRLKGALVRPWRYGDEESLARHANNRNVSRNLRDLFPFPYTTADAIDYVSRRVESPELSFCVEVDGEASGGIALHPQTDVERQSAEIGYWLGEAKWGRGIMTAAVKALTQFGLGEGGFVRIYGSVFSGNTASMRVLEKAGYIREGRRRKAVTKDGMIIDDVLYAAIRE